MDWNKLPKQFCDSTSVAFRDESFFVAMTAGSNGTAYSLTPKHAKNFLKSLQYAIEKYEEQFGEIESNWEPGVKSPLQQSGPDQGESKQ